MVNLMRKRRIVDIQLPAETPKLSPANYINRELSWIAFNYRVLAQAEDERVPLLERIKFLAIVSNNTDEFFMVRVASVHKKVKAGLPSSRPDGLGNPALLDEIRLRVTALMRQQRALSRGDRLDDRTALAGVALHASRVQQRRRGAGWIRRTRRV